MPNNELTKNKETPMSNYKLTVEMIEAEIKKVQYHNVPDTTLTICTIILQNGYTVTGESSCIDPNLYIADIGKKTAYAKAFNKLWEILGYPVKQRWYEEQVLTTETRLSLELGVVEKQIADLHHQIADYTIGEKHLQSQYAEAHRSALQQLANALKERIEFEKEINSLDSENKE